MFGNVMPSALRESWFCVCACVDLVVHVFYLYVFIGMSGEALCSSRLHVLLCVFVCVCVLFVHSPVLSKTQPSHLSSLVCHREVGSMPRQIYAQIRTHKHPSAFIHFHLPNAAAFVLDLAL